MSYRVKAELDNGSVVETNNVADLSHDEAPRTDWCGCIHYSVLAVCRSNLAVRAHLGAHIERDQKRDKQWADHTQENLHDIIKRKLLVYVI